MDDHFEFALGQIVEIIVSGERGTVTGRAEYDNAGNSYLLVYCGKDGATQNWWDETRLQAV